MSVVNVRAALETALAAMSPSLATSWENQAFTPPAISTPYQVVNLLTATPDNDVYGTEYREMGYMQVRLMYPQQAGSGAAMARAQAIRDAFYRGRTVSSSGTDVVVQKTAEILPAVNSDGRYQVTVKVRFFAYQS